VLVLQKVLKGFGEAIGETIVAWLREQMRRHDL
jgi:hypothetical protein